LLPLSAIILAPTAILLSQRANAQTLQRAPQIRPGEQVRRVTAPDWQLFSGDSDYIMRVDSKSGALQVLKSTDKNVPNPNGAGKITVWAWTPAAEGNGISAPEAGDKGRYQFVKGNNVFGDVFRYDSLTGKVWTLVSTNNKPTFEYYATQ
jgi:hypothetical protein